MVIETFAAVSAISTSSDTHLRFGAIRCCTRLILRRQMRGGNVRHRRHQRRGRRGTGQFRNGRGGGTRGRGGGIGGRHCRIKGIRLFASAILRAASHLVRTRALFRTGRRGPVLVVIVAAATAKHAEFGNRALRRKVGGRRSRRRGDESDQRAREPIVGQLVEDGALGFERDRHGRRVGDECAASSGTVKEAGWGVFWMWVECERTNGRK